MLILSNEEIEQFLPMPGTPNIPAEIHKGWWNNEDRWKSFIDLADLIAGRVPGRSDDRQITCFVNNLGLGLQFAALGILALERARRSGIGRELPGEWFSEIVHP